MEEKVSAESFQFISGDDPSYFAFPGFLCGECPDGKGVDLTLRQCKDCTVRDAIFMALFCKHSTLSNSVTLYDVTIMILEFPPHKMQSLHSS